MKKPLTMLVILTACNVRVLGQDLPSTGTVDSRLGKLGMSQADGTPDAWVWL